MKRNEFDPGFEPPEPLARPKCPNCAKPLRPWVTERTERRDTAGVGFDTVTVGRRWSGHYQSYGAFCTLRCCEQFANDAYRAGYSKR
jgi:hypothetical protein